jgi:hypothetical protein
LSKSESQKREDEMLLRMLKTPPQPRDEMKARDNENPKALEAPDQFRGLDRNPS